MTAELTAILRQTELFRAVPAADLAAIQAASRLRSYRRGQVVFRGSTRQSVNAALRGFERRGWIRIRDRAVIVQQEAELSRFARSEMSAS